MLVPGVYLVESLTKETKGYSVTSIVNTLEEDITIDSPHVELEETENVNDFSVMIFTTSVFWDSKDLSILCEELKKTI